MDLMIASEYKSESTRPITLGFTVEQAQRLREILFEQEVRGGIADVLRYELYLLLEKAKK